MITTYNSLLMDDGAGLSPVPGRVMMFVPYEGLDADGSINSFTTGDIVAQMQGFTFIVDSFLPDQFEKLRVNTESAIPVLELKAGETLEDNRTETEKLIAEKEAELYELRSQL